MHLAISHLPNHKKLIFQFRILISRKFRHKQIPKITIFTIFQTCQLTSNVEILIVDFERIYVNVTQCSSMFYVRVRRSTLAGMSAKLSSKANKNYFCPASQTK